MAWINATFWIVLLDEEKLSECAPDSEEQQKAMVEIQDLDAFNWG